MPSDQAPTATNRRHDVPAGGGHPPVPQTPFAAPPRRRAAALRRFARHYA
jgi:hypothetical protein